MPEAALSIKTHISPEALYRHIRKLESRGFVKKEGERVWLVEQKGSLGKVLLDAALS